MVFDPNAPGKVIADLNYRIHFLDYYQPQKEMPEEKVKEATSDWISQLGEMFGNLRGIWLSGSLATSTVTNTYPYLPRNTDIALFCEEETLQTNLEEIFERAREEHSLFPFRRHSSAKVKIDGNPRSHFPKGGCS